MEEMGLVPVSKIDAVAIFRKGLGVDELIGFVKEKAYEVPQDVSTKKSREAFNSQAFKITRSKTFIESVGKSEVEELKKETKQIDSVRKKLKDELDKLRDEYRLPLTKWEEEQAAIEAAEKLKIEIEMCHDDALKENETFDKLRELEQIKAEQARKEAEEAARIEKERLEKERIEREERIAKEAAEKAKAESEAKAKRDKEEAERKIREAQEAAEKAERDRIAAEERAKIEKEAAIKAEREKAKAEAERVEMERLAKIEAERLAEEKRVANKHRRSNIERKAVDSMVRNGFDMVTSERVIMMISQGKIDHITINY